MIDADWNPEALPPLPDGEDDDLDIDMGEGPGGAVE